MLIPYNAPVQSKRFNNTAAFRSLNRILLGMCIFLGLAASVGTSASSFSAGGKQGGEQNGEQSGETNIAPISVVSIPAARQADRVAVITIKGTIDAITAMSVKRRIEAAEKAGMEALVIEINSPGGELGAVLEISNMLKTSSIDNTVAWIHPDAYSGGAIIALACHEIVTSSPASMGDAFVITVGAGQIRSLSPDERTKFLPPLMAEVTDSARRSGYDEYMVQAIVADGIELWFVEEIETGNRLAINEEEYRLIFEGDVVRGKPMLAEVAGGVRTGVSPIVEEPDQNPGEKPSEKNAEKPNEETSGSADAPAVEPINAPAPNEPDPNAYRPASPTLRDIEEVFIDPEQGVGLESPSTRKVFSAGDRGKYRLIGYITDGSAAIVMRDDQMRYFGFSTEIIQNDDELKAFFGAEQLVRVHMSWSEKMVRFLVNPIVRGFIIVVLLLALFVEMAMAGTGIAGTIALGALVLLLGPPAMIGLSGWWELIAIVAGVICLAIEAFVVPGFGFFGVVGLIALFGGLIGSFVSTGGAMSNPDMQRDLTTGAVTVLLAFITAGIGWWLLVKNAQSLPIFDKFLLSGASGVGGMPQKTMLHAIVPDEGAVRIGSEGITTTPLYPVGQADIEGEIVDVYSAFGFLESGVRVRVISATKMRIDVEAIEKEKIDQEDSPAEGSA